MRILPVYVIACPPSLNLLYRAKLARDLPDSSYDAAWDAFEKAAPGSYLPSEETETFLREHWHELDLSSLATFRSATASPGPCKARSAPPRRIKPRGRPTLWSESKAALLMELFGRRLLTKRAAAKKAGIGYQTLMDWQRQRPAWGKTLNALHWQTRFQQGAETVRQWKEQREAKRLQRCRARPAPRPRPTKQMRMVCWYLVHRVHPQTELAEIHESTAARRFGMTWSQWVAARTTFPGLMANVQKKRTRRLAYGLEHGSIANGWTPPDPNDKRTGNFPWGSFYWERGKYGRDFGE